jgi:hypothetical protein
MMQNKWCYVMPRRGAAVDRFLPEYEQAVILGRAARSRDAQVRMLDSVRSVTSTV